MWPCFTRISLENIYIFKLLLKSKPFFFVHVLGYFVTWCQYKTRLRICEWTFGSFLDDLYNLFQFSLTSFFLNSFFSRFFHTCDTPG